MKENSELLAQQAKSVGAQVSSGPTIELVTPASGRMESRGIICPPNCFPNCPPVCPPNTRICEPVICPPVAGLPRPPRPSGPPRPN